LFNDRYGDTGWRAISAGLSTIPGWPVSEHSVEALREFGIDCRGMTSKPVSRRMLRKANLVVTMTTMQREWLRRSAPELKDKIISMADISEQSQDIADPFGETLVSYRRVRDELSEVMDDLYRFLQHSDLL
jgi:protein-tyrosine phosphatase